MTALRRLLHPLLLAAALVALLAGCGSSKQAATGDADPAGWAPKGAPVYAEATVRPGEPLRGAVDSVARKVSLTPDWRAKLIAAIDRSGKRSGTTYSKDIGPWLGSRVGLFVSGPITGRRPPFALIVDVRDEARLKNELAQHPFKSGRSRSASYRDVDYKVDEKGMALATVKGALVLGTEAGLKKVVDVSKGDDSLTDDDAFKQAKAQVTPQRVAFFYVDVRRLIDLIPSDPASPQGARLEQARRVYGALGVRPFAAALSATPSSISLDAAVKGAAPGGGNPGQGTPLFAGLPGDAWLALGAHDYGAQVKRMLGSIAGLGGSGASIEQLKAFLRARTGLDIDRDVLSWIGDTAIYVRGTTTKTLGGAAVISSKDPRASQRAVAKLATVIKQLAHKPVRSVSVAGARGFAVTAGRGSQPILMLARADRVVIAYGQSSARDALAPKHRLGDSPQLRTAAGALGSGLRPTFYVAVPPIVDLARAESKRSPEKFRRAERYLRAYRFLVGGSRRSGDTTRTRVVLGLR